MHQHVGGQKVCQSFSALAIREVLLGKYNSSAAIQGRTVDNLARMTISYTTKIGGVPLGPTWSSHTLPEGSRNYTRNTPCTNYYYSTRLTTRFVLRWCGKLCTSLKSCKMCKGQCLSFARLRHSSVRQPPAG